MQKKTIKCHTQAFFVGICEQLAQDLIDYKTNSSELKVEVDNFPPDYDTRKLGYRYGKPYGWKILD